MPGLVPGIHVLRLCLKDVDGRDEPGHDVRVQGKPRSSPSLNIQVDINGHVIGGLVPAAHVPVDARAGQSVGGLR